MFLPQHSFRLTQSQLHHAWVDAVACGKPSSRGRRPDGTQCNSPVFCLRDDLVLDHQDVAVVQAQPAQRQRIDNHVCDRVTGEDLTDAAHGNSAYFATGNSVGCFDALVHTAASQASRSRYLRPHDRNSRCAWVSPSRCSSNSSSCGLSTSKPIPGNSIMTNSLPVRFMAAQCGWKLSLPKRSGMIDAGRRRMQLLPRPSYAGTSTAPSPGATSSTLC